jgi:hypothetical protein
MAVEVNSNRKLIEVSWTEGLDHDDEIKIFAVGAADDVHNTGPRPNSGLGVLAYPSDFSGSSDLEVRTLDDEVLDSGTIAVG